MYNLINWTNSVISYLTEFVLICKYKMKKIYIPFAFAILVAIVNFSCNLKNVKIENDYYGELKTAYVLELVETKKFRLDSFSAPRPIFIQLFNNSDTQKFLSFLNEYNNCIYLYNYNSTEFYNKFELPVDNEKLNTPFGYYIKNIDSIYCYDKNQVAIVLIDTFKNVLDTISLTNWKNRNWTLYYPQYFPKTVKPFFESEQKLILTGQNFLSIPDSLIDKFKFSCNLNLKTNNIEFFNTYPKELYGKGVNWEGGEFTEVFSELHPDRNKIIYSFPVSHFLYIAEINSDIYEKVFAGSNEIKTIESVKSKIKRTKRADLLVHHAKQDIYGAIIYDKYRKLYYRFLRRAIENANYRTRLEDKIISIIILDDNFEYLGETNLGTGIHWNWQNSFVTKEGLNIEFTGNDYNEDYLTFKIFTIKNLIE